MKKYIISLIFLMGIANFLYPFDESKVEVKTGNFYFLVGTEGNERAIMYLHIVGERAYGSYYTESQSIINSDVDRGDGFSGSFDGRNLNLEYSYYDNNERLIEGTIKGTLSGDIVFRGKHNSKNVNLSLANTLVNSARIIEDTDDYSSGKKFTFNKRILNNLDYYGRLEDIIYLDENIIIFRAWGTGGRGAGYGYLAYSIHTGKEINPSDFISDNFLDKYELWGDSEWGITSLSVASFYITPNRKIVFYYDPGTTMIYLGDEDGWSYVTPGSDSIEFTFEEIKPFIKKGSVLEYLFN